MLGSASVDPTLTQVEVLQVGQAAKRGHAVVGKVVCYVELSERRVVLNGRKGMVHSGRSPQIQAPQSGEFGKSLDAGSSKVDFAERKKSQLFQVFQQREVVGHDTRAVQREVLKIDKLADR